MRLDIYSDVICPWCFIGKRRLERALAARPQPDLAIHWRAFQLNPGMPPEGMDRQAYLEAKFGGSDRARRMFEMVRAAGAGEGIDFAFDRIKRTPSTLNAHRLVRFAAQYGLQARLLDAIFEAYFLEGRDIGSARVLADVAVAVGFERAAVRLYLQTEADAEAVLGEDRVARRLGISGVPCFVFNGRFALSGAQEPEALFQLFDLAREDDAMSRQLAAQA
ncbi:MAG: DsbA family oxidoreductase [Rhodospirillaceae bacterium]|nr:DsbA family oxidoreductase [Rhodospirillaceae bacterium]